MTMVMIEKGGEGELKLEILAAGNGNRKNLGIVSPGPD